jgi:hypothetical protein
MSVDISKLDSMQSTYKSAVNEWINAIRQEEELASVHHSVAELDKWENAGMLEEESREKAKAAKKAYEGALREQMFNF